MIPGCAHKLVYVVKMQYYGLINEESVIAMSAVIGRLCIILFLSERNTGDQYMWFDYIKNSLGTCILICICMQRNAEKYIQNY